MTNFVTVTFIIYLNTENIAIAGFNWHLLSTMPGTNNNSNNSHICVHAITQSANLLANKSVTVVVRVHAHLCTEQ